MLVAPDAMMLPLATRELLQWLDAKSGAGHAWVNVDIVRPVRPGKLSAPRTYGHQIRRLVDAGLAEVRKSDDGERFMRITSLGRVEAIVATEPAS